MRTASCKKITIYTSYFHADNWRFVLTIKRHNLYHINLPPQPCFTFPSAICLLTMNVIINEQADVFAGIQKGCIVEYMQSRNIPVYLSTCAFLK